MNRLYSAAMIVSGRVGLRLLLSVLVFFFPMTCNGSPSHGYVCSGQVLCGVKDAEVNAS